MKLENWKSKLIASDLAGDDVKHIRKRVCHAYGYKSVADIPHEKADEIIEEIAYSAEAEQEFILSSGAYEWWK